MWIIWLKNKKLTDIYVRPIHIGNNKTYVYRWSKCVLEYTQIIYMKELSMIEFKSCTQGLIRIKRKISYVIHGRVFKKCYSQSLLI
jgi:hypothetical protein